MIEKIDAGTAIRLLDAGKAVAVDVREPDEYAVGHIPGAKLLPLGEVNSRAAEVLPEKEATWLVYCRTGRRSAEAVQKLDALGYRVETDHRSEKIGFKIRSAQMEKVPYMLVAGDKDIEAGTVSVRSRKDGDEGASSLEDFIARITEEIATKAK